MMTLVLAMITLQSVPPEAVATPAASIGDRLTGRNATDSLAPGDPASFGQVSLTVGCTYGTPHLGPALLSDVAALSRTFDAPACSNATGPASFAGTALVPLGFYEGLRTNAPFAAPVLTVTEPSSFTQMHVGSHPYVIDRLALPAEMTAGAGPASAFHVHAPVHSIPVRRVPVRPAP
jgi:hypothetical protein